MNGKWIASVLLQGFIMAAATLLSVHGPRSHATSVEPPDFESLLKQAEVILTGEVTATRSEWVGFGSQRHIETCVTLSVINTLKGAPPNPYVLRIMGGIVGDTTLEIDGVPKFKVGDRTLLFVENNGTQFVPLVGIMHGYFKVARDPRSGEEVILKHNGKALKSIDEINKGRQTALEAPDTAAAAPPAVDKPLKKTEFEGQIRQRLKELGY